MLRPRDRKRVPVHGFGNHRARADIDAVFDLDRRNERGVRTDERAIADLGAIFIEAVVVAGDRTRTDVGTLAHRRVTKISEMVGF